MQQQELSFMEIVNLIEAGKIVRLPCTNLKDAESIRNNISSRLYKQRAAIKSIDACSFDSVVSKMLLDSEGCYEAIEFKLGERKKATFTCTIIEPEPETTEQHDG